MITLGIIGVIAALTLPGLIAKYQKQQVVTKMKKFQSAMYQAMKLSEVENGPAQNWEKGSSKADNTAFLQQYVYPYLKTIKTCLTPQECGAGSYYYKNGDSLYASINGVDTAILSDGTLVMFQPGTTAFWLKIH